MTITTPGVIALASFDVGFFAFLPRWVSAFRQFFRVYTLAGETPSVTCKSLRNHFSIAISTTDTTLNVNSINSTFCLSSTVCSPLKRIGRAYHVVIARHVLIIAQDLRKNLNQKRSFEENL